MPRPKKLRPISITVYEGRDANGRPTGIWHGWLPTGEVNSRGQAKRAHREATDREACEQKIRELEDELAERARLRVEGRLVMSTYTLHAWLRYWLDEIVRPNREYQTVEDYAKCVDRYLIPHIVDVPLTELGAGHIEEMLKRLRRKWPGKTDIPRRAYIRLRIALNAACKRPKETGLWSNPCAAVPMPRHETPEVKPLTVEETQRVLLAAMDAPDRARWTVAFALGLRQGETLGLTWEDIDWDSATLWVRWAAYRRRWHHGCTDPHTCAGEQGLHRAPCPGAGAKHARYHRRGCPTVKRPCPAGCADHADRCPKRHGGLDSAGQPMQGGMVRKPPKSKAGKRPLHMEAPLLAELRRHRAEQSQHQLRRGDRWHETGAVFARPDGRIMDKRRDGEAWKALLVKAGVRGARLHDARHTTATILLMERIEKRVVMEMMGWSDSKMADRYQHVLDAMRREATGAVAGVLFAPPATDHATDGAVAPVLDMEEARQKRA